MTIQFIIFFIISLLGYFTDGNRGNDFPYNVSQPQARWSLPPELNEVSGITTIDSLIACVQDENGIVFLYNLKDNSIVRQITFGPAGDYEDIARVGSSLFVLRSDGLLYEIADFNSSSPSISTYYMAIPAKNNEGLCYDEARKRLLIAVKGKSGKGKRFKYRRDVFAFDLTTRTLLREPVLSINVARARDFALSSGIELPVKYRKKGKRKESVLKMNTSAIAIHPVTRDIYMISASDHMLFVFEDDGALKHIQQLNALQFNKPEGLAFLPDGTMFISNEAVNAGPAILQFSPR